MSRSSYGSSSLRRLRLDTASDAFSASRTRAILAPSELKIRNYKKSDDKEDSKQLTNFSKAPSKTLSIVDFGKSKWTRRAEQEVVSGKKIEKKESRRVKKKREWLERQEAKKNGTLFVGLAKNKGDWALLPDLILQEIFQYLPYKVSIFWPH